MGIGHIHPRLAAGQAAMVERLNQAVLALRDDGIESLTRAGAALRRLPGGALTGAAHEMATEIDRVIAELATVSNAQMPTIDMIHRLELTLVALSARIASAHAARN